MSRQSQLRNVVEAFRSSSRLAHLLHGRQQHADQDADNGDHHQQFN